MADTLVSLLFVGLAVIIVLPCFPLRWSLLAYLIIIHLEFTILDSSRLTNILQVVILPTILLLRTNFIGFHMLKKKITFVLWLFFVFYVVIGSLWTPFRNPALELLGYLYGFTVSTLVLIYFTTYPRKEIYHIVICAVFISIGLAVIQTYLMGGRYGGIDRRFTSFIGQQNFGLYLAAIFALIISTARWQSMNKLTWIIPIITIYAAMLLNGSRQGFVAITLLIFCSILLWIISGRNIKRLLVLMTSFILASSAVIILLVPGLLPKNFEQKLRSNRALQVIYAATSEYSLQDVGTFRFRLDMYQVLVNRLQEKSFQQLVFGSGTSSTAELITQGYIYYRVSSGDVVDANRVAHNEFLRVFFEWGMVGSVLFLLFIISLIGSAWLMVIRFRSYESIMLFASILLVIVFLSFDNIFASSGSPLGVTITLLVAWMATFRRNRSSMIPVSS